MKRHEIDGTRQESTVFPLPRGVNGGLSQFIKNQRKVKSTIKPTTKGQISKIGWDGLEVYGKYEHDPGGHARTSKSTRLHLLLISTLLNKNTSIGLEFLIEKKEIPNY